MSAFCTKYSCGCAILNLFCRIGESEIDIPCRLWYCGVDGRGRLKQKGEMR